MPIGVPRPPIRRMPCPQAELDGVAVGWSASGGIAAKDGAGLAGAADGSPP